MAGAPGPFVRCGIDTVEVARVDRLVRESHPEDLAQLFSAGELADAGAAADRLAARFAAKEACLKLFPRETVLGEISPADFAVERDGYGAPRLVVTGKIRALLDRHRLAGVALSLSHDGPTASAIAVGEPAETVPPPLGRFFYRVFPVRRRVVLENLHRVFGERIPEAERVRLAGAFYAHAARSLRETIALGWMSPERRARLVRIENEEIPRRIWGGRRGILYLTGHLGNWELAAVCGIERVPDFRNRLHVLRRPVWPRWLDRWVHRRFRRAGVGVIPKLGGLGTILERLEAGDGVVFVLDQFAAGRDGVEVEFFGHPTPTFRSLAVLALATGAPVVPIASWREPDGTHVLRFEEPLPTIEHDDPNESIRRNTRVYNAALERMILRHPEQWFWMHRRWK